MEGLLTSEDLFLKEYRKGDVTKANLVDTDFEVLVEQYNKGDITFNEYYTKFYNLALNLIKQRLKIII